MLGASAPLHNLWKVPKSRLKLWGPQKCGTNCRCTSGRPLHCPSLNLFWKCTYCLLPLMPLGVSILCALNVHLQCYATAHSILFLFFHHCAFYSPLSAPFPSCWNIAHCIVGLTGERHTQGCVIFGPGKDLKWGSQASTDVAWSTPSISSLCLPALLKGAYFATPPPRFSFCLIIFFHLYSKCLYIRFYSKCNHPTIPAPIILLKSPPNKLMVLSWEVCCWQANPTPLLWQHVEEKLSLHSAF